MKTLKYATIEAGQEMPPLQVGTVTHAGLVRYAGASGDFNPIHTDPVIAREYGLDGTIAHGMLVMGFLGRYATSITDKRRILDFGVKFKGMAKPGQTITCTGKVRKKKEEDGKNIAIIAMEASDETGDIKATGEITVLCD